LTLGSAAPDRTLSLPYPILLLVAAIAAGAVAQVASIPPAACWWLS